MFGLRRRRGGGSPAPRVRVDGAARTVVVEQGASASEHHRVADLVLIRRERALELADDRWIFSFRPEGVVEVRGREGDRLARNLRRLRPDLTVHVHHPDDD